MVRWTHPFPGAPPPCGSCGVETVIRLESLIVRGLGTLTWHCMRCHAYWPALLAAPPPCVAS
jgi:hypothetical protein